MKCVDILSIGPHPDDVEIGCAGFIVKARKFNYQSQIVVVTDGQSSLNGDSNTRIKEATESALFLTDKKPIFLHEYDGFLENNLKLRIKIANLIRNFKPKIIISPFDVDKHPDHVSLSLAVKEAIFMARSNIKELEGERHNVQIHLEMLLDLRSLSQSNILLEISDVLKDKFRSLDFHRSQSSVINDYLKLNDAISKSLGFSFCEAFNLRFCALKDLKFIGEE